MELPSQILYIRPWLESFPAQKYGTANEHLNLTLLQTGMFGSLKIFLKNTSNFSLLYLSCNPSNQSRMSTPVNEDRLKNYSVPT